MHWLQQDVYPGLGTRSVWFATHKFSNKNSEKHKMAIFLLYDNLMINSIAKGKIYVQVGNNHYHKLSL